MHTATPTATTAHPIRRIAVAAVLAILTLATALGLTATPASAEAPSAPAVLSTTPYDTFVRLFWAPPANDGGKKVTSYTVERWVKGQGDPQKTWTVATSAALVDTGLQVNAIYQYRVRAINGDGPGAWSKPADAKLNPSLRPLHKFGDDPKAFVTYQYQSLLGRKPGFGELNTATLALKNGTTTVAKVIDEIAHHPERTTLRHPVIRLYLAYFDRAPDHAGLDHWIAKRANGTKLDTISQSFANSSEFKNTYGALSNVEFLELVYANVLDRAPDANGIAYWTGRLEAKTLTRGQLMTNFSESNEHKGKARGRVELADLHDDMLNKAVHPANSATWAAHLQGGGNQGDLATRLMLEIAYQP
jgi:hypothetical protein